MEQEAVKISIEIRAILLVLFVAAIIFWAKALNHGIKAYSMVLPGKKLMVNTNPIGWFTSKYFTADGNHNRKQMLKNIGLFLVAGVVFVSIILIENR